MPPCAPVGSVHKTVEDGVANKGPIDKKDHTIMKDDVSVGIMSGCLQSGTLLHFPFRIG